MIAQLLGARAQTMRGCIAAAAAGLWVGGPVHAQPANADETPVVSAQQRELLALGQRIYRDGLRASGEPLASVGAAQARLSGKEAACATCHRRSGYGTSEGPFSIRPIVGPALAQQLEVPVHSPRIKARLGTTQRPPYTEDLLARAIRSGLDASGRPLDRVMPRYALTDEEMKALTAYLFALSAQPSPGVDDKEVHFATIVQPGVSVERRRAMLEVMQAFVKDKDANVRQDDLRREAGTHRMYRAYRKWVLHVWQLSGPSGTWAAQLETLYKQQPVFALVGGLGNESWQPIHEFSERFEIPCVFPQAELPVTTGANQYTLYLSKGLVLDAQVLAKYFAAQGAMGKVVQVYRRRDAGSSAGEALRAAWVQDGAVLEDKVLDGPPTEAFWHELRATNAAALVLWLSPGDLAHVPAGVAPVAYLSFNETAGRVPQALVGGSTAVRWIYPADVPPKRDARLLRSKLWMHNKGIALKEEAVQINTQFAMTIVSDALGHIMDRFSRDYFVERIEHVVGQTPSPSMFQNVSLGPGQRFAAKGSSVVEVLDVEGKQLRAVSGWIVP